MKRNLDDILNKYWFFRKYREGEITAHKFYRILQIFREDVERETQLPFKEIIKELSLGEVIRTLKQRHPIKEAWALLPPKVGKVLSEIYNEKHQLVEDANKITECLLELKRHKGFRRFIEVVTEHHTVDRLIALLEVKDPRKYGLQKWTREVFYELNELLREMDEYVTFEKIDSFVRYNFQRYYPNFCKDVAITPTRKVERFFNDVEKRGLLNWMVTGRDILLGKSPNDFDVFVMPFLPEGMKHKEYNTRLEEMEAKYDIDFMDAIEYEKIGWPHKLFKDVLGATEFTINKIFIKREVDGRYLIVDLFGGYHDLQNSTLRIHLDTEWRIRNKYGIPLPLNLKGDYSVFLQSLKDLTLLAIRAGRFAVEYGLQIESNTDGYLRKLSGVLKDSEKRYRSEADPAYWGFKEIRESLREKFQYHEKKSRNKILMHKMLSDWDLLEPIRTLLR